MRACSSDAGQRADDPAAKERELIAQYREALLQLHRAADVRQIDEVIPSRAETPAAPRAGARDPAHRVRADAAQEARAGAAAVTGRVQNPRVGMRLRVTTPWASGARVQTLLAAAVGTAGAALRLIPTRSTCRSVRRHAPHRRPAEAAVAPDSSPAASTIAVIAHAVTARRREAAPAMRQLPGRAAWPSRRAGVDVGGVRQNTGAGGRWPRRRGSYDPRSGGTDPVRASARDAHEKSQGRRPFMRDGRLSRRSYVVSPRGGWQSCERSGRRPGTRAACRRSRDGRRARQVASNRHAPKPPRRMLDQGAAVTRRAATRCPSADAPGVNHRRSGSRRGDTVARPALSRLPDAMKMHGSIRSAARRRSRRKWRVTPGQAVGYGILLASCRLPPEIETTRPGLFASSDRLQTAGHRRHGRRHARAARRRVARHAAIARDAGCGVRCCCVARIAKDYEPLPASPIAAGCAARQPSRCRCHRGGTGCCACSTRWASATRCSCC